MGNKILFTDRQTARRLMTDGWVLHELDWSRPVELKTKVAKVLNDMPTIPFHALCQSNKHLSIYKDLFTWLITTKIRSNGCTLKCSENTCCLQSIYSESVTTGRTDRHLTKWSLIAAGLHRWHKKVYVKLFTQLIYEHGNMDLSDQDICFFKLNLMHNWIEVIL